MCFQGKQWHLSICDPNLNTCPVSDREQQFSLAFPSLEGKGSESVGPKRWHRGGLCSAGADKQAEGGCVWEQDACKYVQGTTAHTAAGHRLHPHLGPVRERLAGGANAAPAWQ